MKLTPKPHVRTLGGPTDGTVMSWMTCKRKAKKMFYRFIRHERREFAKDGQLSRLGMVLLHRKAARSLERANLNAARGTPGA